MFSGIPLSIAYAIRGGSDIFIISILEILFVDWWLIPVIMSAIK